MAATQLLHLIGAASGIAAGDEGCAKGPLFLQQDKRFLADIQATCFWDAVLFPKNHLTGLQALPAIAELCQAIADYTQKFTIEKKPFVTLGGDHSCAIGTWNGVAAALPAQNELGLLWIDAHLDAHTPDSSESGNIHGMPVASLLGYGSDKLINIGAEGPALKPQNICLLGIRSYEPPEMALLQSLGVRVYCIDEVIQRGMKVVMQEALALVSESTVCYGISIDLDGIDPKQAPAVGTPVEQGIDVTQLLAGLALMKSDSRLVGLEIAEFNPELECRGKTTALIKDIINALYA